MDTKVLASLQNQVTNAAQINPHVRYVVTKILIVYNYQARILICTKLPLPQVLCFKFSIKDGSRGVVLCKQTIFCCRLHRHRHAHTTVNFPNNSKQINF